MNIHDRHVRWCNLMLRTLIEWDEPITKTELIILMGHEQNHSYLLGLMNGLWFGGYLSFTADGDDTRMVWVEITPLGRALYDEQMSLLP